MQIYLILALLVAIVAVIFAVQNVAVVAISFFAWHIQVPLAVALLAAVGAGALIAILLSIPGKVKGRWNSASHKKKFSGLETERDGLKAKVEQMAAERDQYVQQLNEAKSEIAELEERLASYSAALEEAEKRSGFTLPANALPPEGDSAAPGGDNPA